MQPFMRDDENQNNQNDNNQNQDEQLRSFDLNLEGIQPVNDQQSDSEPESQDSEAQADSDDFSENQEDLTPPLSQENDEQDHQSVNFGSIQSPDQQQEQNQKPLSFQTETEDSQQEEDREQETETENQNSQNENYTNAQPSIQEIKISSSQSYEDQQQQQQPPEQPQGQQAQQNQTSQLDEQNTSSSFNPEPVAQTQNNPFAIPDEEQADEDDGDFLEPASSEKKLKQSTIVMMVLFLLGGACVWFMIKKTTPAAVNAALSPEETRLEQAIASINNTTQTQNKMQDILDKFYKFSEFEQISVSELKKNPFAKNSDIQSVDSLMSENMDSKRGTTYIQNLKLWSVIDSNGRKSCMIGDKILTEGDSILNYQVSQIDQKSVELVSNDGASIVLKITE